jgi:hypothetical protein
MKKFIITAAALFAITASAHAETYSVDGVTIHIGHGCRSSSCVSVDAPGYGSYHGGRSARLHKAHKDTAQVASVAKKDDSTTAVSATPAAAETPAVTPAPAASDTPAAK